ncbi:MAG: DMT family transporter [Deltaproteobacteria bacterium]|nr:DMT family transporter [Deltaproteobacteria bacterium]
MHSDNASIKGYALVILSSLGFSFIPVLASFAYTRYSVDPTTLALMRTYVALPFFAIALATTEGSNVFKITLKELAFYAFLGAVCGGLSMLFAFHSVEFVGASVSTVLIFTYPAMTVALGTFFFKEKGSATKFIAAFIVFIGLLLVLNVGGSGHPINRTGILLALTAAFLFALYHIYCEQAMKKSAPLKVLSMNMLMLTVFLTVILGIRTYPLDSGLWAIALILGSVCGFLSMLAFQFGLKELGAAKTALISSLGPVFTATWAYFALSETLSATQIIGMLVVIGGIIMLELLAIAERKKRKALDAAL